MEESRVKILDCTIRDGGLCNKSAFGIDTVRSVYGAACAAGIDYIELGYRNSKSIFPTEEYGPWRFCDETELRKVVEGIKPNRTKISIMQDAHKAIAEDVIPKAESVASLIRIATYIKDIDKAVRLANNATKKGYDCSINIMAISRESPEAIRQTLARIQADTDVQFVYIVDSYGALYADDVRALTSMYREILKNKSIGIHCHNNQQLAFANSIEGIKNGADIADGTLFGLGRGSGNCPIELLAGYIRDEKYKLLPLLEAVENAILPLRNDIEWGYHMPYMLSGLLNQHPGDATEWMQRSGDKRISEFYDRMRDKAED